jgi:hypothetical protein
MSIEAARTSQMNKYEQSQGRSPLLCVAALGEQKRVEALGRGIFSIFSPCI